MAPNPYNKYLYENFEDEFNTDAQGRYQPLSPNTPYGQAQQAPMVPNVPMGMGAPMSPPPTSVGAMAPPTPTAMDPDKDYGQRQTSQGKRDSMLADLMFYGQNPGAYDPNAFVPEGWVFDPQSGGLVPTEVPGTPTADMYGSEMAAGTFEGIILSAVMQAGMTPEQAIEAYLEDNGYEPALDDDRSTFGLPEGSWVVRNEEGLPIPQESLTYHDFQRAGEIVESAMMESGQQQAAMNAPPPQTEFEERGFSNPWETYGPEAVYDRFDPNGQIAMEAQQTAQAAAASQAARDEILARAGQRYMDDPGAAMQDVMRRGSLAEDGQSVAALNYQPGDFVQGGNIRGASTWDPTTGAIGETVSVGGGAFRAPQEIAQELALRDRGTAREFEQAKDVAWLHELARRTADQQARAAQGQAGGYADAMARGGQTPFNDQLRQRQAMERAILGF